MPAKLKKEIAARPSTHAKIAAFKVEIANGEFVELWVAFGDEVGGRWNEHRNIPPTSIKIENGIHPLAPKRALRRCPSCGAWYALEAKCASCGTSTVAYDGYSRLVTGKVRRILKRALYDFLTTETVPDPITGEEILLLDATCCSKEGDDV
jgi:hypothetical protein